MFGNGNVFLGNWFPFPGFVLDTLCLETETCFLETGFRFQGLLGLETETCFLETGFCFQGLPSLPSVHFNHLPTLLLTS